MRREKGGRRKKCEREDGDKEEDKNMIMIPCLCNLNISFVQKHYFMFGSERAMCFCFSKYSFLFKISYYFTVPTQRVFNTQQEGPHSHCECSSKEKTPVPGRIQTLVVQPVLTISRLICILSIQTIHEESVLKRNYLE